MTACVLHKLYILYYHISKIASRTQHLLFALFPYSVLHPHLPQYFVGEVTLQELLIRAAFISLWWLWALELLERSASYLESWQGILRHRAVFAPDAKLEVFGFFRSWDWSWVCILILLA